MEKLLYSEFCDLLKEDILYLKEKFGDNIIVVWYQKSIIVTWHSIKEDKEILNKLNKKEYFDEGWNWIYGGRNDYLFIKRSEL